MIEAVRVEPLVIRVERLEDWLTLLPQREGAMIERGFAESGSCQNSALMHLLGLPPSRTVRNSFSTSGLTYGALR